MFENVSHRSTLNALRSTLYAFFFTLYALRSTLSSYHPGIRLNPKVPFLKPPFCNGKA
jgi:hypothetical protein